MATFVALPPPIFIPPDDSHLSPPSSKKASEEPLYLSPEGSTDRYRVIEVLGRGGDATVLKVLASNVSEVAMKVYRNRKIAEREAAAYALIEGAPHLLERLDGFTLSRLYHIHQKGNIDIGPPGKGNEVMITKLMRYPDVYNMFIKPADGGPTVLGASEVLEFGRQGLETLSFFHRKGLAHLDIKPENMFYRKGKLKIFDFGCARKFDEVDPNEGLGTPEYRSPEQILFYHYTPALADVWALGAVLYELFTGFPILPVEGRANELQTIVDSMFLLTKHVGVSPWDWYRGPLVREPSRKVRNNLRYFDGVGERYGYPVWKGHIAKAVQEKNEKSDADVNKLIALLEQMICYKGRKTAEQLLAQFGEPTEQKT